MLIQNMDTLAVISKLLRVREETLRLALTTRTSRAGGADLFVTPYKMEEVGSRVGHLWPGNLLPVVY